MEMNKKNYNQIFDLLFTNKINIWLFVVISIFFYENTWKMGHSKRFYFMRVINIVKLSIYRKSRRFIQISVSHICYHFGWALSRLLWPMSIWPCINKIKLKRGKKTKISSFLLNDDTYRSSTRCSAPTHSLSLSISLYRSLWSTICTWFIFRHALSCIFGMNNSLICLLLGIYFTSFSAVCFNFCHCC